MLSDLLRPFQPKCADVPLGFYLDSSVVCNRLTAQRVSAASLCLFHFLPLLTLLHIHSVCVKVCDCIQLCRRRVCLTSNKMFRDNKREMISRGTEDTFLDRLQSGGPFFHCRNFSRNRFKDSGMLSACRPQECSFDFHSWTTENLQSQGWIL